MDSNELRDSLTALTETVGAANAKQDKRIAKAVTSLVEQMQRVVDFAAGLKSKVATLEQRVAKLEQSKQFAYRGTFDADDAYETGDFVSCQNSLWCCIRGPTSDVPGKSAAWRLAAKV